MIGISDLWWNWYLTPVMNFSEVQRTQLAKSTLISTLVPLGSIQMLRREWGAGSYFTYLSLVKRQPCFLSLQWKTCLRQTCSPGFCTCIGAKGDRDFWIFDLVTELIFNPFGEFRLNQDGPVRQIHSPHLHVGAHGILSHLLRSFQMLKRERERCGKQREATAPIHP